MRAPVTWLRELVQIPVDQSGRDLAARLIAAGLEVERVETIGGGVDGSLVIGCVLEIAASSVGPVILQLATLWWWRCQAPSCRGAS